MGHDPAVRGDGGNRTPIAFTGPDPDPGAVRDYTGAALAATPPQADRGLREALLRIFDLAENRPDIRSVAQAALAAEGPGS